MYATYSLHYLLYVQFTNVIQIGPRPIGAFFLISSIGLTDLLKNEIETKGSQLFYNNALSLSLEDMDRPV